MSMPPEAPAPDGQVTWISRERSGFERPGDPTTTASVAPPHQPGKLRIGIIIGVLLLLAAAFGAWKFMAASKKPADTLADRGAVPLISIIVPALRSVTSNVSFTGAIAARYDMQIGNEGDTGRIVAVYVEAGDHVKRGQVLAKIDDSVIQQQVNRLAASLDQARAQAALSAAEYKRALGVEAAGALSAEDIEKRKATAVTDAANVKVVDAQLAETQARLGRTRVTTQVEGTVLTRRAEIGQIAAAGGDPLFRVASGGEVEMRGQIAEQDLSQIKVGQAATVYLTGLARPFTGNVRLLGAIIDPLTRLGDIRIALKPGAFARGVVNIDTAQRPVLPQTAVMADSNGSYVLIVNSASKVERRAVQVSGINDVGAIISSGLTGNERVVSTAGGFLRDGEQVKIAPAPAAGT
jgi:RND family efflux transporter MFP subunit